MCVPVVLLIATLAMNWCGRQNMMMSAWCAALSRSGSATTFSGSFTPGRYLMFSWRSLINSLSLRF